MNFIYPTAAEIFEIAPDLMNKGRVGRVGLDLFPMANHDTFHVRWTQRDNYYGLQQMRGIDGAPPKVQRLGSNSFVYEPGVYGEHTLITERELLTRAVPNHPEIKIPVSDLILADQALLANRQLDRMEANAWTLAGTGTLTIPLPGPAGPNIWTDTYTIQTFTASIPWSTTTTATPIADLQTVQQKQVGHSVSFGADATLYLNQVQANRLLNNSNTADFGGRRDQYGATLNNLVSFNNYFQGQNLPKIVVYDAGYQLNPLSGPETAPSTQFQKFIPNGVGILVGARTNGAPIGHTQMTIQAMMPGGNPSAGVYSFVKDYAQGINAPLEVPPKMEVHMGWNGGTTIEFPSAIVALAI